GCARCYAHCPEKAIDMVGDATPKKAYIRRKDCIRCYCCQELCPYDAVKLKKPLLYRIMCLLNSNKKKQKTHKNDPKTNK
ncbi:MAG: 4Fe-4S dicluster domain-containing protein, partial [Clostridia bacterium]|nr:4Fe-4S dicluster domain-containing protein [Clostridia bacterium]